MQFPRLLMDNLSVYRYIIRLNHHLSQQQFFFRWSNSVFPHLINILYACWVEKSTVILSMLHLNTYAFYKIDGRYKIIYHSVFPTNGCNAAAGGYFSVLTFVGKNYVARLPALARSFGAAVQFAKLTYIIVLPRIFRPNRDTYVIKCDIIAVNITKYL